MSELDINKEVNTALRQFAEELKGYSLRYSLSMEDKVMGSVIWGETLIPYSFVEVCLSRALQEEPTPSDNNLTSKE